MSTSNSTPDISYHPSTEELNTQLNKFSRSILESTKSFGRWWRGFCTVFEERLHDETAEKYIPFTFFDDVMQNKMISQLHFEVIQCKTQISGKFEMHITAFQKKGRLSVLFDKNLM
jgi:hypothetical protein